jgi:tryptophan synthase beta chain
VRLVAVEAAGDGLRRTEKAALHSASLCDGTDGVLHGAYTKLLQDAYGQVLESHSVAAGLDYSGVGPQLAHLAETGRIETRTATNSGALDAFSVLSRLEGILPALESSHALALVLERKAELGEVVLICLSGRGDKDLETVLKSVQGGAGT